MFEFLFGTPRRERKDLGKAEALRMASGCAKGIIRAIVEHKTLELETPEKFYEAIAIGVFCLTDMSPHKTWSDYEDKKNKGELK